ncbi:MAG: TetR/AcrR family transcriptional regulator [Microthrixaceae bacterium]
MSRRLTPRGEERRAQLLAYATRRFAEDGYHPTSVADIVDGLGVGKGVFYWYFSSKEELFLEILRTAQKDLRRTQRSAISEEPDPLCRLEFGIRAGVLWMATHSDQRRLFEFARTDQTFADAVLAGQKVLVGDAVTHLRAAVDQGQIPDRDLEALGWGIIGVSNVMTRVYIDGRNDDPETVADMVVAFCMEGFGGGT